MKMIKAILILIVISPGFTQAQTLNYSKKKGTISLVNDSTSLTMTDYKKSAAGVPERTVTMNGIVYKMSLSKSKKQRIQTITNEQGEKLATVLLNTSKIYSMTLQDGTELVWKSQPGRSWV